MFFRISQCLILEVPQDEACGRRAKAAAAGNSTCGPAQRSEQRQRPGLRYIENIYNIVHTNKLSFFWTIQNNLVGQRSQQRSQQWAQQRLQWSHHHWGQWKRKWWGRGIICLRSSSLVSEVTTGEGLGRLINNRTLALTNILVALLKSSQYSCPGWASLSIIGATCCQWHSLAQRLQVTILSSLLFFVWSFEHFVFAFDIVFVFVFKWTIVDSNTQISFIHFLIV